MLRVKFLAQKIDFAGKTLIMPSLCTEAPSIALDHLIASNKFQKIGIMEPPFQLMVPSIGYLPKSVSGSDNVLGLPIELYILGDVIILQLRSTVRFCRAKDLIENLAGIFEGQGLAQVLMVGVLKASARPDSEISSANKNLYFLHSKSQKHEGARGSLVSLTKQHNMIPLQLIKDEQQQISQLLQGAGLAKRSYDIHSKSNKYRQKFSLSYIFVFGNDVQAKETGLYIAQKIRDTLGASRKELSQTVLQKLQ